MKNRVHSTELRPQNTQSATKSWNAGGNIFALSYLLPCVHSFCIAAAVVMGDSAKKRLDSIRFTALSEPPRQSTPGVVDSDAETAGPGHGVLDN